MDSMAIKDAVRERYADIARQAFDKRTSCCDSSSGVEGCCGDTNAIPDLPQHIANTSLGCGTPLEIAQLQPGETVLDLGSGGGLDCLLASRLVGPTGRAIGVDMTPEMIALANKNAQEVGATNVEFRQGYLENLPLADESVDVIISNCVINLSPDKDRVFREAFRVLKPGGRVAFSDMVARVAMPESFQSNLRVWAACVSGAITQKDYIEKMGLAGFIEVAKVAGGESGIEPVYSAKIIAQKPQEKVASIEG